MYNGARVKASSLLARIVVGLALLAARPALADDTVFVPAGRAPAHDRDVAMAAASRAGAADPGNGVLAATFSAKDVAALTRCLTAPKPWTCIAPVLRGKRAQRVAVVTVDAPAAKQIAVTAQIATPTALVTDKRYCEPCTDELLAKVAGELTRDLLRELATRDGRTVLSIQSRPRGAQITLDGKPVGATDTVLSTYPGPHHIGLERTGHQPATRDVDAVPDKVTEVVVPLTPVPVVVPPPAPAPAPPPPRPTAPAETGVPGYLTWGCIGLGGAALATGIVMIAIDGPPAADPRVEQPRYYTSYQVPGIVTGVAGALTAGFGVYLLHRQHARAVVTATPTAGGAALSWTGAF